LYTLLQQRLPKATVVSIAHHPALSRYHQKQFRLAPSNGHAELLLAGLAETQRIEAPELSNILDIPSRTA